MFEVCLTEFTKYFAAVNLKGVLLHRPYIHTPHRLYRATIPCLSEVSNNDFTRSPRKPT